jgi:hypothetical protein
MRGWPRALAAIAIGPGALTALLTFFSPTRSGGVFMSALGGKPDRLMKIVGVLCRPEAANLQGEKQTFNAELIHAQHRCPAACHVGS